MTDTRQHHPSARRSFLLVRLSLVALAAWLALVGGCGGAKQSDSPAEPGASATPPPATTPAAGTTTPAPDAVAMSPAELGAKVFATRCALCHGADGHGDGVGSKALNPKPRNFHDVAYMKSRTDAQLLEVIHTGKGAMPRWQGVLSEAEISAVLAHVRTLASKP